MLDQRETQGVSLDNAARCLLGVSRTRLGIGIAERWSLPERIVAAMSTRWTEGKPLHTDEERVGALADFSASLCEIVVSQSPGTWEQALSELLTSHRGLIRLNADEIPELLCAVGESVTARYSALGLEAGLSRFSRNVNTLPPVALACREPAAVKPSPEVPTSLPRADHTPVVRVMPGGESTPRAPGPLAVPIQIARSMSSVVIEEERNRDSEAQLGVMTKDELDAAVRDLARRLGNRATRGRLMVMALQLLSRYLGLPRLVALVADSQRTALTVESAVGEDADALRTEVSFPLRPRGTKGDLFTSAYYGTKDVTVEDAFAPAARCLIPTRYYEAIGSSSFVLISCAACGHTWVMVLADCERQSLPSRERLATLGECRALIVSAIR